MPALPALPFRGLYRRITGQTRRIWVGNGRAHIEHRPAAPDARDALSRQVVAALEGRDGVRSAAVNPFVQRVVVAFDDAAVSVDDLVEVVERVEAAVGLAHVPFPPERPDHPGDVEPLLREAVQLLSNVVGLGGTVYGRVRALAPGPVPHDLSWLLTIAENVPQVREAIERSLGSRATDLSLGVSNSLLRGVTLGVTGQVVDVAHRVTRVREIIATRSTWADREPQLGTSPPSSAAAGDPRPARLAPLPDGPVERYAERAWPLSLGAFAAMILTTEDVQRAAAPLLDGIPKAARLGRGAFVSQLGQVLAQRGCLVLTPAALHILDRVDTVVVDGELLGHDEDAVSAEGHLLLRAVRTAGHRLLVTADEPAMFGDLDEVVDVREVDARIAGLQDHEGAVVLAVGTTGAVAFRRADIRAGIQRPGQPPAWDADVLCTGELADGLLLVRAVSLAHRNSRQAVTLAATGAGIGATTGLGGLRRDTPRRVMQVVDAATMLAMGNGLRLASNLAAVPRSTRSDETPWHALPVEQVLDRLGTSLDGLPPDIRDQRYAPPQAPASALVRVGRATGQELANPLTPVLAGGIGLSLATGSFADAGLVGAVIALNAAIGGAQRYRAEKAVEHLHDAGRQVVRVRRQGVTEHAPAAELVPGDVVELGPGEPVPADCRVVDSRSLEVDESSLTGESVPVPKTAEPTDATDVADRASMVHQGTTVAAGEGVAVVVAIGEDTQARRALAWTDVDSGPETGVEARLEQLTRTTVPLALFSAAGVSVAGLLRRTPMRELVDTSIGLAVAAVPEGLPLLASAAQRAAARRLSRHQILVRDPRAIEALGRVDVLCADKTGTLTEGRIRLAVVSDGMGDVAVDAAADSHERVLLAARRATPIDPTVDRLPHPTDQAVAAGTEQAGISRQAAGFAILDDLPFEPDRSYHAVLADTDEGRRLSLKGAPEEVLSRCARWAHPDGMRELADDDRRGLVEESERLAARGLRVLAVAERDLDRTAVADADVADLVFVGFLGLRDPVRPVSRDSIERLRRAGVDTIMITGDHPTTARSIATELGLDDGHLLTGADVDELDDDALAEVLPKVTVFARVTPLHKVRIVRAFQSRGRVVAMTGDGANDAPAIRLADVGIAVGKRATAAAREAADIVILEDRLEVIVDAIAEGRGLWGSVRDAVAVLVGGNLGEISFTLLGSVVGRRPPLNTRQLLLVNLLTDVAPAMALAVRSPTASIDDLLAEGPERSLGEDLNRALVWRGAGAAAGATSTFAATRLTGSIPRARTAGLVALVGAQLGQTIATSRGDLRVVATGVGSFAVMGAMIQTPGISRLVGCRPMGPVGWLTGAAGAALGTTVGITGPWVERQLAGDQAAWSATIVGRLAELGPDLPGLVEA